MLALSHIRLIQGVAAIIILATACGCGSQTASIAATIEATTWYVAGAFQEVQNMTVQEFPDFRKLQTAVQRHWKALLIEGILLVVLGLAAIIVPSVASLAFTIFVGWLLLIGGLVELTLLIWARLAPGFWWSLLSSLLAIGAGAVLIARPVQGTLTLTIVLSAYFAAEGIVTVMYALQRRNELQKNWRWLVVSGIVDLVIACCLVVGLPGSAVWAIGLLVGIDLVFGGFTLIGIALAARKNDGIPTNCGWGQAPPTD